MRVWHMHASMLSSPALSLPAGLVSLFLSLNPLLSCDRRQTAPRATDCQPSVPARDGRREVESEGSSWATMYGTGPSDPGLPTLPRWVLWAGGTPVLHQAGSLFHLGYHRRQRCQDDLSCLPGAALSGLGHQFMGGGAGLAKPHTTGALAKRQNPAEQYLHDTSPQQTPIQYPHACIRLGFSCVKRRAPRRRGMNAPLTHVATLPHIESL
ncbi:hypothetical protein GGR56DRAFT_171120 [Xylariaceae sp. FL0804]|nr:hypothetical protein GGR56DRAFT_171120 [Xylariaceae sp. FL0804]